MYTIGKLAKKFGLSRSTLLYYDSIGLLKPNSHTRAGYRHYSEDDAKRLEQICLYRRAGLSLKNIAGALDFPENRLTTVLEKRLQELNEDIQQLREQQRFIVGILKNSDLSGNIGVMNKDTWTSILAASGFSEEDMRQWHIDFERLSPQKHLEFLQFLCIPETEIGVIRSWSSSAGNERAHHSSQFYD